MLKIGNFDVIKICIGEIEAPRAYLGDIEVYSNGITPPKESYAVATFKVNDNRNYPIFGDSFNKSQFKTILINGVEFDFNNNSNQGYLTRGDNTVIYYMNDNFVSMDKMWFGCSNMTSIDVSNLDVSNVTNFSNAFYWDTALTAIIGMDSWDTSNVTNMSSMFFACYRLTQDFMTSISNWNTSNVTDMYEMFYYCSGITSADLRYWDFSNVTNMSGMFSNCSKLTSLYVNSPLNARVNTSNMFLDVQTDGTFYYNINYNNAMIEVELPVNGNWTAEPYNFE